MPLPKEQAWFRAKRYGYGWGLPRRWQGWCVFGLYALSIVAASALITPARPWPFAFLVAGSTAVLIAICAWKGEAPKWRWGNEQDEPPGRG